MSCCGVIVLDILGTNLELFSCVVEQALSVCNVFVVEQADILPNVICSELFSVCNVFQ